MFRMGSLFGTKNKMAPNQLLKGGFPLFTRFCFNLLSWLLETSPGFQTPPKGCIAEAMERAVDMSSVQAPISPTPQRLQF